jgi:uncharacterized membrane protein
MARHPRWTRRLFTEADLDAVTQAIVEAERATSAEIQVHLERRVHAPHRDPLRRARDVFADLGMHRAAQHHGVLIYLAVEDHKLAIVGDQAIHARVGDRYWEAVRDGMVRHLREGRPRDALLGAVADVARVLAEHFPRRPGDADATQGNEMTFR